MAIVRSLSGSNRNLGLAAGPSKRRPYLVDEDATANAVSAQAAIGAVTGVTAQVKNIVVPQVWAYSIVAQSKPGAFQIDANTGVVTVADTGMDPFLKDVDAATNEVSAAAAAGATVGVTGNVINPGAETWTYAIVSDSSNGGFQIDPNSGVVTVLDPTKLTTLAPVLVDGNVGANTVSETDVTGATVGVTAQVQNPGAETWTYAIVSDSSNGGFQIDANTGVVTVADGSKIVAPSAPANIAPPTILAAIVGQPVTVLPGTWT